VHQVDVLLEVGVIISLFVEEHIV
jgi:hypothetical protein